MAKWGDVPRNVTLTVRITEEEKQKLSELAEKNDVRISYLAYEIIKQYIQNQED